MDRTVIAAKLRHEVIPQLVRHRASHQSWLDHFIADPTYSCPRCTPEVIAGVGNADEQRASVAVYNGLIATCEAAADLLAEDVKANDGRYRELVPWSEIVKAHAAREREKGR